MVFRSRAGLALSVFAWLLASACGEEFGASEFVDPNADGGAPSSGDLPPGFVPSGDAGPLPDAGPPPPTCGNAVLDPGETCDDGNTTASDGCSAQCKLEPGWKCPTLGAACTAAGCGDGIVAGDEDCDDGNSAGSDGCSATCVLEPGFHCPTPGKACVATVCGDNKKEGTEQCDDGNVRPYDGCAPDCTKEPTCTGGTCTAVCGDGVKFPGEDCDDGNTRSGDGCSATCKLEPGFSCTVTTSDLPASIDVPIVYRDFKAWAGGTGHPDFENYCCGSPKNMPKPQLGTNGVPELLSVGSPQMIDSAASFAQWYVDTANVNMAIVDKLTLTKQPDDSYQYSNSSFFPLDGKGFGDEGRAHNFHFTSELRYWFTFKGGEVLDFTGDDDVFVFVNGKLAVDLGGVHGAENGSVTLDPTKATQLGLTANGMYELDLFQAERHTSESNYKLTLRGFVKARTSCTPICGDGIKTKGEACDDGKNTGGYGKCAPGCVLGPRCGDGIVQAAEGEQCDDGNLVSGDGCSGTCQTDVVVPK